MKTKKLFVDAHTFDEDHQGIRTFLKGIYTNLEIDPKILEVYLAGNNLENLKKEFSDKPGFKFLKLRFKNKYIRLAFEIPRIIRKHKFDFAHFNYYLPLILNKKCKYIVTIHDVLFIDFPQYFPIKYRLINTFLFRRSAIKAHLLNTVSNYSAHRIRYHFRLENKTIKVLPNAPSEAYFNSHDKDKDKIYIKRNYQLENYILYVSRIEPRKNHKGLIRAFLDLELWKEEISLVLIGKESFKDKSLDKLIDEANMRSKNRIVRLNNVANDELIRFYNAARLFVFPSFCEGFGIPPLESAILKTPTICANVTAMKDFVFFEKMFFDPNSQEELTSKISEAINQLNGFISQEELKLISVTIKEKYNWSKSAQTLSKSILNYPS